MHGDLCCLETITDRLMIDETALLSHIQSVVVGSEIWKGQIEGREGGGT